METWMDELEKAVRRDPAAEEETEDEGGYAPAADGDEGCAPKMPMKKGKLADGGRYPANENGDDDDAEGVGVHSPDTLDNANQRPGKKQKLYPADSKEVKKSLIESVDGDVADAIDVSDILSGLCKGIDSLASGRDAEVAELRAEVAGLSKGLQAIGKALVKSLEDTNSIAKSLTSQVEDLSRQPAGRKSTVRKIEKSFGGADEGRTEFPNKEARLEKSMSALKAGKISPVEASMFETACNRGEWRSDLWRKMGGE